MQSKNPVFARVDGFNGRGAAQPTYSNDPSQWRIDLDEQPGAATSLTPTGTDRMTIDTVVEKTALTLAVVIGVAAATWFFIGDMYTSFGTTDNDAAGKAYGLLIGGALIGFVLAMVNSFKKKVSPALVLLYAVAEGVFVGAFSKVVTTFVGEGNTSIVFQAVLATMVAFGATLAAYRFFDIQVTDKFRRIMFIALAGVAGVMLINFVLSITGVFDQGGLRGFNTLGLIVSIAMVGLAVFTLIMDFDLVEQGVRAGLPANESWRAAFALTVTLVWLYTELLRIIAILNSND